MKTIAPIMHQNLVISLLKLFGYFLGYFNDQANFDNMEEKDRIKVIDNLFVFSIIWSLGACVTDRRNFNI